MMSLPILPGLVYGRRVRRPHDPAAREREPVSEATHAAIDAYALSLALGSAPVVATDAGPAVLRALPLSPPGRR